MAALRLEHCKSLRLKQSLERSLQEQMSTDLLIPFELEMEAFKIEQDLRQKSWKLRAEAENLKIEALWKNNVNVSCSNVLSPCKVNHTLLL